PLGEAVKEGRGAPPAAPGPAARRGDGRAALRRPPPAAVAFGSNVGDRARHIDEALARLRATPGVAVQASSSVRETEPVGGPPQGRFLNGVALLETTLGPEELLAALLAIERAGGRVRAA